MVNSTSEAELPSRNELVIRNAHVVSVDRSLGDMPDTDIHVRNGEIIGIGHRLVVPHAEEISAGGMIAMPGFVETHWHCFNSVLRNMAGPSRETGYFPLLGKVAPHFTPADMYVGVMLSAVEAVNSGITTVHDWCNNPRSPEHAFADLDALGSSGIRARFSLGSVRGIAPTQTMDLQLLESMHRAWSNHSRRNLIHLGMAWRGVQYAAYTQAGHSVVPMPAEVVRKEFDTATKLGIPITVHANSSSLDTGHVAVLKQMGCLQRGLQIVHGIDVTDAEIEALTNAGATVCFSPFTDGRAGFGVPRLGDFLRAGVATSLSVDTVALGGSADMFGIMKATLNVENARVRSEFALNPRKVLEMATIDGARCLGIEKEVGSLRPGKRADIILLWSDGLHMTPFADVANMITCSARPSDVDTVIVDGRILKRDGKLVAVDQRRLSREVAECNASLRQRAQAQ